MQPGPDDFDFGWLDRVLKLLDAAGIGVCLATPTASPPPWFTRAHPDAMPVTRDGVRLTHGSRDTYCVNAPAYRAASVRIADELATRYAGQDAVRLWHVHNEYGTTCYCDHCAAEFRGWLAARYGDVGALNDAWSTDFWSQRYRDWAEVLPPRATQYLANPAQELDYRRFVSDAMLRHYLDQRAAIRRASPVPVTTNFVLGGWVPVDHARWAREVDVVAIDDYPASVPDHLAERAFAADRARGWALAAGHPHGRWLLMEHAPGAVRDPAGVVRPLPPGQARQAALTYLDRGAAGVLYFQWRASRGGAEQWHPAIVPHEGDRTPIFEEICALGAEVGRRAPVSVSAPVALIYDEQSMWAWQSPHLPTREIDYEAMARRWHGALGAGGTMVDVVPVTAPLRRYRLVAAPALYLMPAAAHIALREYVSGGGTLVLTFAGGLVDDCSRATPGALDDLIGARVVQHVPLLPRETVPLAEGDAVGRRWLDHLEPAGATVLLRTADGRAAVTEHRFGAGAVRYAATDLDERRFARMLFEP
jgi:beta-galactosidase